MPANESGEQAQPPYMQHLELLIALVSLLLIQTFLSPDSFFHRAVLNGLFLVVVLSTIRTLSRSRVRMWTAVAVGSVAYALSWVGEIQSSLFLVGVIDVCFIVFFGLLIIGLAESVFGEGPVDANRIIGAVSIFFILGLLWAFIYALLELVSPGSFRFNAGSAVSTAHSGFVGEFVYFSNVTLTTLGYGDFVPVSALARMLATLQAMVGQLYIAIIIARMVAIHVSQGRVIDNDDC